MIDKSWAAEGVLRINSCTVGVTGTLKSMTMLLQLGDRSASETSVMDIPRTTAVEIENGKNADVRRSILYDRRS